MKLLTNEQKSGLVGKAVFVVLFSIAWIFIAPFIVTRVYNNELLPLLNTIKLNGSVLEFPVAKYWHTFFVVLGICGTVFGVSKIKCDKPKASSYVITLIAIVVAIFIGSIIDCAIWNNIIVNDFACLIDLPQFTVRSFFALTLMYMIVTRKIKVVPFTDKDKALIELWRAEDNNKKSDMTEQDWDALEKALNEAIAECKKESKDSEDE